MALCSLSAAPSFMIHFLLSSIEDRLRDACQQGDLEVVKSLLKDLDTREARELLHSTHSCTGTPLFDAIISQQKEVVQYLLNLDLCDLDLECEVNIFYPLSFRDSCTYQD